MEDRQRICSEAKKAMRNLNWLFPLLLFSCNSNSTTPEASSLLPDSFSTIAEPVLDALPPVTRDSVPPNIQIDSVVMVVMPPGDSIIHIQAALEPAINQVICRWKVDKPQRLQARIKPENGRLKLRFAELLFPDQSIQGPFGRDLNIELEREGMYQLRIAPNQMAGSKNRGEFEIFWKITNQ